MGTRGFIGFIIKGKRRGCYVQYDSYPEGLGVQIVMFILSLSAEQRQLMIQRLQEVSLNLFFRQRHPHNVDLSGLSSPYCPHLPSKLTRVG